MASIYANLLEQKKSVYIRKEFNSHRAGLGRKHGRRFIVLGHKFGRRDDMWKHKIFIHVYRILYGKCRRTVFSHELLTYQKSNEWAQRTSEISDTKTSAYIPYKVYFPRGIVFVIYVLRHSSLWQPLYLKSFQNAKFAATYCEIKKKTKHQLISKNVC